MSISEFDNIMGLGDDHSSSSSKHDQILPVDFSDEDVAFAQELNALFDVHNENLPPYLVQTLLEADDPRFEPVQPGFEYITRARVFRRLDLPRRIFRDERPSLRSLAGSVHLHKPLMAFCSAMLLLMFVTVMFTGPSFAMGMQMLLGGHFGIMQTNTYPNHVNRSAHVASQTQTTSSTLGMADVQSILKTYAWEMYWPTSSRLLADHYNFSDLYFIQQYSQGWTDGPFIQIDYSFAGKTPQGTGALAIGEFKVKPNIDVLQVVKQGTTQTVQVAQNGAQAIFINGQWIMRDKIFPTWVTGKSCELIFQRDGIVFWIVGDPTVGMNEKSLMSIAESLMPLHINHAMHSDMENNGSTIAVLSTDVNGPFAGVVLAIAPDDSGDQIQYLSLGSNPIVPENPDPRSIHRSPGSHTFPSSEH